MWGLGNFYKQTQFRKPKDGYLVYRRQLHPKVRTILTWASKSLKWLVSKIDENDRVNREILSDLGLPDDSEISKLDAFYKKEFRKKKYIYYFKKAPCRDLPEPLLSYKYFVSKKTVLKTRPSFKEFLQTFEQDLSTDPKESRQQG